VKHPDFDIIIVGGGHAGIEAASAASRLGKKVALVTMDRSKLALMSCNPSIGGLGKSHIVKEIDALGGLMPKAIDATGIQFRRLNLSRGPAVWSTRAQADRIGYNDFICRAIGRDKNINLIEGTAGEILVKNNSACGIKLENGQTICARMVILCTGTFLGGLIYIGDKTIEGGRKGEKAALNLTNSLKKLGLEVGRLKTGTPPRLDGKTIDYDKCEIQPGEEPIPFFSYRTKPHDIKQVPCHLTYTTSRTKEIIMKNLKRSAMFSGKIQSVGPRYCPSIEDKIYRFRDKSRHHIFLEPEGNGTDEIYPNGFSTSLPLDVQEESIKTIIGLEEVKITKPGYAIEYDYCPSHQIKTSLETRVIGNLYMAGQINGTSGYEEAAGLGMMAGVNAALRIDNQKPFILDRSESYIGVMIDDLVTRSTTEPYRMFTSRAEYRLRLREDNARDRLSEYAKRLGLISVSEAEGFQRLVKDTDSEIKRLRKKIVSVSKLDGLSRHFVRRDSISLADLLKVPDVGYEDISKFADSSDGFSSDPMVQERAAIFIKYEGYIKKQEREVKKFQQMEQEIIPGSICYKDLTGLRNEAREKFARFRPTSLGQAGRIEGITTGDLAALSIHIRKLRKQHSKRVRD
jgi:tRNA uridine 5-carboxymethylaminomethyl modification enzyme